MIAPRKYALVVRDKVEAETDTQEEALAVARAWLRANPPPATAFVRRLDRRGPEQWVCEWSHEGFKWLDGADRPWAGAPELGE